MARLPAALETLLHELTRLPGVGRRGAERLATHLLDAPAEQARSLAAALERLHRHVRPCARCGMWAETAEAGPESTAPAAPGPIDELSAPRLVLCSICGDPARATGQLCVVERPADLWAFEQAGSYRGVYHVLGGALSPLGGVTAEDLRIAELEARLAPESVREVIVATNASVDGDATAHYLAQRLASRGVAVTRIAQGVPLGGHLDYADAGTLRLALEGRRPL